MWVFLSPFFLWAAFAASVPLILHLIQRRRSVRIPFSTLRFLKLAEARSAKRSLLENLILWLMRTILVLLITLAFAMPVVRTRSLSGFFGKAERDVAIVLDHSYSMTYSLGGETVWTRAIEAVSAILNDLGVNDRVCVYLAADDVVPLVEQLSRDRATVLGQFKSLEPGAAGSRLCPAVLAAYSALAAGGDKREREIHIVTDGQSLPWASFRKTGEENIAGDAGAWDPAKIDERTDIYVTILGAREPENAYPFDVKIEQPLILKNESPRLNVTIGRTGNIGNSSIGVSVDGAEVKRRAMNMQNVSMSEASFSIEPLPAGIHEVCVETPPDNLPIDNKFHLLIRVRDSLPCLTVGSKGDAFYLTRALVPGEAAASALQARTVAPAEFGTVNPRDYSCIFLCNALNLPGQAVEALEQRVAEGGLLVVFPGEDTVKSDFEPWARLTGTPADVVEMPQNKRKQILCWEKPMHPVLRTLRPAPGVAPIVTLERCLEWNRTDPGIEVLVTAGAEMPFLVSRKLGEGAVMAFSVPADRSWSSLPLSPFYLPLIHQIVQFGAGMSAGRPYVEAARSLSLAEYVPAATEASVFVDPKGRRMTVRGVKADRRTALYLENLTTPGIYKVAHAGMALQQPALAVNIPRRESDLTPVNRGEIAGFVGKNRFNVASDKEDLFRQLGENRMGRALDEHLLWLAFILAMAEVFYANRRAKTEKPLSAAMRVDPSGKVR